MSLFQQPEGLTIQGLSPMLYTPIMYEVIVKKGFSAAHQLRDSQGVFENIHGHNWQVDIAVGTQKLDPMGVVADFKIVEESVDAVIQPLDHQTLNEIPCFEDVNPSAENIARYIFEELKRKLSTHPFQVKKITVWETRNCGASYSC